MQLMTSRHCLMAALAALVAFSGMARADDAKVAATEEAPAQTLSCSIEGTVKYRTGAALPGATVKLAVTKVAPRNRETYTPPERFSMATDAAGHYRFEFELTLQGGVNRATFVIGVDDAQYVSRLSQGFLRQNLNDRKVDLTALKPATIRGKVMSGADVLAGALADLNVQEPIACIVSTIESIQSIPPKCQVRSDASGEFIADRLYPGPWTVSIDAEGCHGQVLPETTQLDEGQSFEPRVVDLKKIEGVWLRVHDCDGHDLSSFIVTTSDGGQLQLDTRAGAAAFFACSHDKGVQLKISSTDRKQSAALDIGPDDAKWHDAGVITLKKNE